MHTVLSMPSNPADPRFRLPRSDDCPNDIKPEEVRVEKAGLCGFCAWGFYRMEAEGPQRGESTAELTLTRVEDDRGTPLGYKAQCGKVELYRDQNGRIGALRKVRGESRFFPGIDGNWAYERYLAQNPSLMGHA